MDYTIINDYSNQQEIKIALIAICEQFSKVEVSTIVEKLQALDSEMSKNVIEGALVYGHTKLSSLKHPTLENYQSTIKFKQISDSYLETISEEEIEKM